MKPSQEYVENEIKRKLACVPLLDLLISTILSNDAEPWIRECQSYYEDRWRTVIIRPDAFEIKWPGFHETPNINKWGIARSKPTEVVHAQVLYGYTESGYLPLHPYSYSYDEGKKAIVIPTQRMCYLWASAIRERMKVKMPGCEFSSVTMLDIAASFSYQVPSLTLKDWF